MGQHRAWQRWGWFSGRRSYQGDFKKVSEEVSFMWPSQGLLTGLDDYSFFLRKTSEEDPPSLVGTASSNLLKAGIKQWNCKCLSQIESRLLLSFLTTPMAQVFLVFRSWDLSEFLLASQASDLDWNDTSSFSGCSVQVICHRTSEAP